MPHILHDLHVAVWAVRTSHPNWREVRLAFTLPISVRRLYAPGVHFRVSFHVPKVHILNAYEAELAYVAAHRKSAA